MAELGTQIAHVDGGVPNLKIEIPAITEYYLGQLIYFFEKACGISGYMLGVNPFDQPGVEAYKKNMFALLEKPGYEAETKAIKAKIWFINLLPEQEKVLRIYLNLAQVSFESFFRGYFSVFKRRIAGYLTRENGKIDWKKARKWPDSIFLSENLDRLLINLNVFLFFPKQKYIQIFRQKDLEIQKLNINFAPSFRAGYK